MKFTKLVGAVAPAVLGAVSLLWTLGSGASEPAPENAELIERGRYIAEAVADCRACHTRRNPKDYTEAVGPEWAGGEEFGPEWLLPADVITPNLTQDPETGLGNWSTEQIKLAIRDGVNREGERLFPLMPSHMYRQMSSRDIDAVVAYLQSLPPRKKPREGSVRLHFPREAIPPLPPLAGPIPGPADNAIDRGRYLLVVANCLTCHSAHKQGQIIEERWLAGGVKITAPWGVASTPNLTPDLETGIGNYTEAQFIRVMKEGVKKDGAPLFLNYMPWYIYKNMTIEDLKDMWAYLRSIKPIRNDVSDPANQFPLGG